MAQTGDWVTPRLYGGPWFEKPILYYWLAAIGFRLQLPAEWAARLPSAFAALAATLAIAWLSWRHYGSEEFCPWSSALLAPLFFSTSVAAIGFSRAATPDMLFAASITLAMASAAAILRYAGALRGTTEASGPGADIGAILAFGAFLGFAVLAKGPAAIILAGGAMAIWALATGRWGAALQLLHPFAIAAFCVVALPWYVVCARRNPAFLHIFIFQHNFERYLTPLFQHKQPFWFFVPIMLLAAIPWLAFVIPAARNGLVLWREKRWRDSPAFFFSCWAFFPILFFSFSQSKLPGYILPAVPAVALLLAIAASRLIGKDSPRNAWIFALLGITWMGLGIGGFIWMRRLPQSAASQVRAPILTCVVLTVIGGMLILVLARRRQRASTWISVFLVCATVEIAGIAILPKLDPYYSARTVGTMLRGDLRADRLFTYELPRAWLYGLEFYLGRELHEWSPTDREPALVLTTQANCEELRNRGLSQVDCAESQGGIAIVPVVARPAARSSDGR